jgi:hypothetical protein
MNIGQHRTPRDSVTGYRDDARTEELHKLRLALATFALQLDAFEMRTRNAALRTGMTPEVPVWPLDSGYRLQGKKRLVDKVTWQQAGRVTEPGRYMFRFGWLTVTAEDLAVWEKLPNAAFSLVRTTAATDAGDEFRLGAFELREDLSLSEK